MLILELFGYTAFKNERTGCFDPYSEQLELTQEKVFVIGVSCLGILVTFLTLLVFVKRRNTPIVSLSD